MLNVDPFVKPFGFCQLEQVRHVGSVFEAEFCRQVDDVVACIAKLVDRKAFFVGHER